MFNIDEDKLLINRFQQGDNNAFDELVKKYQDRIYRQCYLFTHEVGDALDLTQEVFIRVFQSLDNFKAQSSFSTWIFRIVNNICIDYSRRKKTYFDMETLSENVFDTTGVSYPSKSLETNELQNEVSKAMDILPPQVKSTIILRYYEGLDYKSISEVLGCRIGSVKSNISKGMRMLRNALLPYMKGGSYNYKEVELKN